MAEALGLTPEQHANRAKGVGGSDLPVLLGLASYKTPVQLWLEKRGKAKPANIDNKPGVKAGQRLEAVVADWFEDETGMKCRLSNKPRTHRQYPFMVGNIDRKIQGQSAGFEAKAWSHFSADQWGQSGTDEVPLGVTAQCAHYMETYDYDRYFVGVLLGGQDFRWFKLERNESVCAQIVTVCAKFWQHVLDGTPPEIVTGDDVMRIYRKSEGYVKATAEVQAVAKELSRLRAEKKDIVAIETKLTDAIKNYLGPVGDLMPEEGIRPLVTWRTSKDSRKTDWQAVAKIYAEILGPDWAWLAAMLAETQTETTPGSRSFLVKDKIIGEL